MIHLFFENDADKIHITYLLLSLPDFCKMEFKENIKIWWTILMKEKHLAAVCWNALMIDGTRFVKMR